MSRRQEMMGFRSGDVCELGFSNCRVPKTNLIGKEGGGQAIAMATFTVSRAAVGAVGLGIARGAFDIALKYAKERVLYGKPIANLQAIQFMLVDMDTEIDAARWLIYHPRPAWTGAWGPATSASCRPGEIHRRRGGGKRHDEGHADPRRLWGEPRVPLDEAAGRRRGDFPGHGHAQIMKFIQALEIVK